MGLEVAELCERIGAPVRFASFEPEPLLPKNSEAMPSFTRCAITKLSAHKHAGKSYQATPDLRMGPKLGYTSAISGIHRVL